MKKRLFSIVLMIAIISCCACAKTEKTHAIELMGAGDRIHDTYTFANTGVTISSKDNTYLISGSVESIADKNVKDEFNIDDIVTHVVAIKLTAVESEVVKDEVQIQVNGSRAYDAEHLNGLNYTFIILEALPGQTVSIVAKWNKNESEKSYVLNFSEDLILK